MYFILHVLMSLTKTQLEGVDGGVDTLEQMGKIFYKYGFDSIFVHFSVDINKCYLLHSLTVTFADVIDGCWCHKGLTFGKTMIT